MKKQEKEKKGILCFVGSFLGLIPTVLLMGLYELQTLTGWPKEGKGIFGITDQTFIKKKHKKELYPKSAMAKGRFYCWGLKHLISRFAGFLWLRKVRGVGYIPQQGPFLIVPNHQSFLDFMLVIFALKRVTNLIFFIKIPYFDMPLWKFFLFPMGHIRADRFSVKKALIFLTKEQLPVVLFAEGTRTRSGKVGDVYPGFGRIAKKIPNLKIIPIGISGAFDVWPWDKKFPRLHRGVDLSIGKPLVFNEFSGDEEGFSRLVMKSINDLTK